MAFLNQDPQRFLEQSQKERRERELEREKHKIFTEFNALARGYLARKALRENILNDFNSLFGNDGSRLNSNTKLLKQGQVFFAALFNNSNEKQVFHSFARSLLVSLSSRSTSHSFAALFLSAQYLQPASGIIQNCFNYALKLMVTCNLENVADLRFVSFLCEFLDRFSNPSSWEVVMDNVKLQQILHTLCDKMLKKTENVKESIKVLWLSGVKGVKTTLSILNLNQLARFLFRVIKSNQMQEDEVHYLIFNYFSLPAFVSILTPETLSELDQEKIFNKILENACSNSNQKLFNNSVEAVNFLGNYVQMTLSLKRPAENELPHWVYSINVILNECKQGNLKKKYYHAVLGWTDLKLDEGMQAASARVQPQVELLWSKKMIDSLFGVVPIIEPPKEVKKENDFIQRFIKLVSTKSNPTLDLPIHNQVAQVCRLFQHLITIFSGRKTDIISGLCRNEAILTNLWGFIHSGKLEGYWELLNIDPELKYPYLAPLELFAETSYSLISILDEKELYETQVPFTVKQLCELASFCNNFCFRCIWEDIIDKEEGPLSQLFNSIYNLCVLLLMRDSRKTFVPSHDFWILKEVKSSTIMNEFEKGSNRAKNLMQKMPHVIALKERILLFKRLVAKEKDSIQHEYHTIQVHRSRLLEDGFSQLSKLNPRALKSIIRVKFVNQQGLPEAGIDQDGVFKEFLELILKQVFDPGLNLFKSTANNVLYPSSTSHIHDNHLDLFEFVGKMLGKAVYEGICVDLYLAPVLLATVLRKKLWAFDELSTLDPELYKNLTFVKHYDGDITDLELSFAFEEDVLGQVKTRELIVGGSRTKVTNDNKIAYIHRMALFRVVNQTQEQCHKFVEGFKTIVSPHFLALFTPHELQKLISGQNSDIDLADLKKHTQYYGGFHGNHKVIRWLWDILEKDFTTEERHLFLKFGTSCSRPPLLGFAYLEPQFSIRCVETSDENDHGDTLGSVIRGFLAIKRRTPANRLPTASTCFNLLKLPNYPKKSILLEKLRYAIHAETGFELS